MLVDPEEYYKRGIPLPGAAAQDVYARLTYCLYPKTNNKRVFLLIPFHRDFLAEGQDVIWNRLVEETTSQTAGNFHQDKLLVAQIRKAPEQFPGMGVAIHYFGPVPVLLTDHFSKQELHGEMVDAQVVLYYKRLSESGDEVKGIYPSNLLLIESLTGDYPIIMQRYFEDVSQIFYAIVRQSSLKQAFEWSKLAEEFLGQSIQSKLKVSTPTVQEWKAFISPGFIHSDEERQARCKLFSMHHQDIFLAQYFRNTALYFINELYMQLGLESKSQKYLGRIESSYGEYDNFFGVGSSRQLVNDFRNLQLLRTIRKLYQNNDINKLNETESNVVWLRGIIELARFLLNINQNKVSPTKGRIFISHNHKAPVSEFIKQQIKDYYTQNYTDRVEILTVEKLPAGSIFREVIKSNIWQADRILVIVPKDAGISADGTVHGYGWLAREAEHALLLGKRVIFLLERGYDDKLLTAALGDEEMHFLSPLAQTLYNRANHLLTDFHDRTQVYFDPPKIDDADGIQQELSEIILDALRHNADRAIETRHDDMVKGYLSQFPIDTLLTILCLNKIFVAPSGFTKEEAAYKLVQNFNKEQSALFCTKADAMNTFTNMWLNAKDRAFIVNGKRFTLISGEGHGKGFMYNYTFQSLLAALQPSASDETIQNWADTLLNEMILKEGKYS